MNRARIADLIRELLAESGAPAAGGLLQTPDRVARSLESLTSGYRGAAGQAAGAATLVRMGNGLTVARGLEFFSLCEHHLLPFFGVCHLGTAGAVRAPNLEELKEIVQTHARRLQLQERLTDEIARDLSARFEPRGAAVAIEGRHLCMMMRGVGKQLSVVSTSSVLGTLRESPADRAEFFALVGSDRRGGRR